MPSAGWSLEHSGTLLQPMLSGLLQSMILVGYQCLGQGHSRHTLPLAAVSSCPGIKKENQISPEFH